VFGPGVIGMETDGLPPGVGILIDTDRDTELAALCDRRELTTDEQFVTELTISEIRLCPCPDMPKQDGAQHMPEAMLAYTIDITAPHPVPTNLPAAAQQMPRRVHIAPRTRNQHLAECI
jgi:hypothetical protein